MTHFKRHSPALALLHACLMAMAGMFGAIVLNGGSPITPEVYGSIIYNIPALFWVGVQMSASGLCVLGVVVHKRTPVIIGGIMSGALYAAFGVLASWAPEGAVLQAASLCVALPLAGVVTVMIGASRV